MLLAVKAKALYLRDTHYIVRDGRARGHNIDRTRLRPSFDHFA